MSLTSQWLDELRARTHLSALIGKSIKVSRAGREWKACCPFHNENTPSFTINDEKGFYHCFGCGAHGDAIRWMTEQRGLPFLDAVKELAASAGMEVPAPDPRAAKRAEEAVHLRDVTEASAQWYRERLADAEGAEARAYLTKRGLSEATITAFSMGYAPDARGRLREALSKFGDALSVEAGMLISVDDSGAPQGEAGGSAPKKQPYDRFRGRLMIPIRDARGRVIAFGGRILGAGEPKYLNSPDTPLFDKGRTLYNLDRAAPAARKAGRLIVVEGYMDVIALAQAGIAEAVAPLGTALTEHQIDLAWRQVPVPILAFDGDAAGKKAAIRAVERALPPLTPGKGFRIAHMPNGFDPDDVLKASGARGFEECLGGSEPMSAFIFRTLSEKSDLSGPEGRSAFKANLIETAEKIEHKGVKSEFRGWFLERFFDSFGWRAKNRDVVIHSAIETTKEKNDKLFHSIYRSALFALSQRPQIAGVHFEEIESMDLKSDDLKYWRDSIVNQIIVQPDTTEDCIEQYKLQNILQKYRKFDLSKDLLFPWNRDKSKIDRLLPSALELIAYEGEIEKERLEIEEKIAADHNLERYEQLHQDRTLRWALRDQIREKMLSLVSDESPHEVMWAA